jgi:hypothetical protein
MSAAHLCHLAAHPQPLERELTDRLQLIEPRLASELALSDQAAVDQGGQPVEYVDPQLAGRAAHRLGGLQAESPGKDGQALQEVALVLAQQLVAPADGAA